MTDRDEAHADMTDPTRPLIDHATRCQRRGAPVLRASWRGAPEVWCPDCGRAAPADDNRQEN